MKEEDQNHVKSIQEREVLAEDLLESAIKFKNDFNYSACIHAHLQRMDTCPVYAKIDAVRLLGCSQTTGPTDHNDNVEEVCQRGIFHVGDSETSKSKRVPSFFAKELGTKVNRIFASRQYTLKRCTSLLLPLLGSHSKEQSSDRIFSGNSFFNHRLDFYLRSENEGRSSNILEEYEVNTISRLKILASLFLFGLAVEKHVVIESLEEDEMEVLIEAALLRHSPHDPSLLVAEVQIYPLSLSDFHVDRNETNEAKNTYLFMTDWPLESLRSSRYAIMPVGYDTLELLSLSAVGGIPKGRILDLCCGNGIQGLFAWISSGGKLLNTQLTELICVDINERACHFTTGNIALNSLVGDISALQGDLYESLLNLNIESDVGFMRILSNPPFVAVPHDGHSHSHSLYAAAGIDGMDIVYRILQSCFDFLEKVENSSTCPSLLMVTEVPNVEESCKLFQAFLPKSLQPNTRIRVAYVHDDVELINDYVNERSMEKGVKEFIHWDSLRENNAIRNRALVLLSISRWTPLGNDDPMHQIETLSWEVFLDRDTAVFLKDNEEENCADEEDAFLTKKGMFFTRDLLLI